MGDFNVNSTSLDRSHNYSNITSNDPNYSYYNNEYDVDYYLKIYFIIYVVTCIIIAVGLPLTLYALYSLVRNDRVAPIYVINLLISDLLQLCCMITEVAPHEHWMTSEVFFYIYYSALMASVGFMVCVALERYLVIACPLWYHFRRTIKASVVVCVVVWALPLVFVLPVHFWVDFKITETIFSVFLLLPFPLLIFFLGGTLKALSAASRVPPDEKRRIVGILVLVLLIYTLLFLPSIIWSLAVTYNDTSDTLTHLSFMFLKLSPLADLFLYVFMRKGAIDRLLASVCCCRMDSSEISGSTV